MPKNKCIHKYKKVKLGKSYVVFKCVFPTCTHYIRYELAEGKLCICNRCDKPMTLTKAAMQLKKPHCDDCVDRKKSSSYKEVKAVLDDILETGIEELTTINKLKAQIN